MPRQTPCCSGGEDVRAALPTRSQHFSAVNGQQTDQIDGEHDEHDAPRQPPRRGLHDAQDFVERQDEEVHGRRERTRKQHLNPTPAQLVVAEHELQDLASRPIREQPRHDHDGGVEDRVLQGNLQFRSLLEEVMTPRDWDSSLPGSCPGLPR